MKKTIAAAFLFASLLPAVPALAADSVRVCWRLDHTVVGITPLIYRLSFQDMGNGNYMLVGSSETTTVTNPPQTVRRVVTGGAVALSASELEVSLRTSDIQDRPSTTTVVESLATSDVHFLLDANLNGTFHIVNTYYPESSDTTSSVSVNSHEGTVTLIDCNQS